MPTNNSNSASRRLIALLLYSPSNSQLWRDDSSFGIRQNTTAEYRNSVARLPKPFGPSPAGFGDSLHWWHNFYSFVEIRPAPHQRPPEPPEPTTWLVRDTSGALLEFEACEDERAGCFG